jgi:hypothetical protein
MSVQFNIHAGGLLSDSISLALASAALRLTLVSGNPN